MFNLLLIILVTIVLKDNLRASEDLDAAGYKQINPGQFPFFVQLQITKFIERAKPTESTCAGTLISSGWVLTAAICFVEETPIDMHSLTIGQDLIVVAHMDTVLHYIWRRSDKRAADQIHIHPEYFANDNKIKNDLALIRLNVSFSNNPHAIPITLANADSQICKVGVLVCFGKERSYLNSYTIVYTNITTRSQLPANNNTSIEENQVFFTSGVWEGSYFDRHTGVQPKGLHSHVDSGSPFICYHNDYPVQYGIISAYIDLTSRIVVLSTNEYTYTHLDFIKSYVADVKIHGKLFTRSRKVTGDSEEEKAGVGARMQFFYWLMFNLFLLIN